MKWFLIVFLLLMASYAGAVDLPYRWDYATCDSFFLTVEFGGSIDTSEIYTSLSSFDTTLSLTGEGLYVIDGHYFITGYGDVEYTDNPPLYYNTLYGHGGGPHTDTIFAYDTLGADVVVSDVNVIIRNLAGTIIHQEWTGSGGYITFPYTATDTFLISGKKFTYLWDDRDTIIGTGNQRDTLFGYNVVFDTATTDSTCIVSVYVMGDDGNPAENVKVTAYLLGSNLTAGGYAVRNTTQYKRTDATGRATFNCLWSSYIDPDTDWRFQIHSPSVGGSKKDVTVPDSVSHTVVF